MKKVLIGVLILIPIIIVASVLLTTNIISKNSYLPVDRVELNENYIEFSLDNGNTIDTLKATVYPRLAKNHNLTWSIEEQHSDIPFVYAKDDPCKDCADLSGKKLEEHIATNHIDIATIDNNGVVTVYGYGSFIVKVTTEEGNKFATCSVKVVGDKVTKIELMPYGSSSKLSENDVISLDPGERLLVNPIFTPGGARNKTVTWKSADERIVEVDKNGILSAKGAGETTISVFSNDNTSIGTSVKVKVNNDGIYSKGESYCYTADTVNVKNFMNVSDFTTAKVAGGTLSSDGTLNFDENATVATVTVNGKTFTAIKVDAPLSDDDIVFKNYDILLQKLYNKNGDEVEYIVKRGLPIYLEVVYRNPEKAGVPEVEFSSNDMTPGSSIVNIKQYDQTGKESNVGNIAMIEPNKEGDVKIVAKDRATNNTCTTVELKVVTPVFAINLALNATDAKRGIAAETVFGNKIFNADCTKTSPYSFNMDFNYPKDVDFENFEFSTSDESIAKFSDEKGSYNKLFLKEIPDEKKGLKNKVIITIKAKYPMYDNMPVVATYVLNVIDGYTVSNETQLKKALHEKKESVAIYVKDSTAGGKLEIRADNNTDASRITMPEGKSMYGNGFIVCFNEQDMIDRKNDYFNELLKIETSNVHVENTILRMGYNDPEAKNGLQQWEKSRRCVRILHSIENYDDETKNNEMINNISFKYCIFENAKTVMEIDGADVNIEGCIFRNSSANSLFIPMAGNTSTYGRLPANVTLKNTVFTHSALMPICVQTDFERDKNRKDENGKVIGYPEGSTWEDMKKTGYKDHFINVEGFLDIYNWINIDEFATTGSGLIPPTGLGDALDTLISQEGSKIIANVLLNDQYKDVRHTINNQEYVHLGIVVIGMTAPVTDGILRNFENAGYSRHRVELTDNVLDTIPAWKVFGAMLKPYVRYPLYVYSYKEGNYQIGPDAEKKLDFQETGALYKNLREGRSTGSI